MPEFSSSTLTEGIGYAASALVLATFCFSNPFWLRLFALASNLAFVTFGYFAAVEPVMLLHIALAPINAFHLAKLSLPRRRHRTATGGPQPRELDECQTRIVGGSAVAPNYLVAIQILRSK